jgi:hypothetical protein
MYCSEGAAKYDILNYIESCSSRSRRAPEQVAAAKDQKKLWPRQVLMAKAQPQPAVLKGWKEVAQFLGQSSSTVQGWAKEGMPIERSGHMVQALPDKLNLWLGRETREYIQFAAENVPICPQNCDAGLRVCVGAANGEIMRLKAFEQTLLSEEFCDHPRISQSERACLAVERFE